MENLTINIYDKSGKEVVKTCTATTYDLMFGTVQKLMALTNFEDLENQVELLKVIYNAWEEVRNVLGEIFPEITDDEWNYVKVKELLPVIIGIAKATVTDFMSIPVDPKN